VDLVQMTVFMTDVRYGERLWQVRDVLGDNAKIEIQGYAVIGSKSLPCSTVPEPGRSPAAECGALLPPRTPIRFETASARQRALR
jgi:hypothetical protein